MTAIDQKTGRRGKSRWFCTELRFDVCQDCVGEVHFILLPKDARTGDYLNDDAAWSKAVSERVLHIAFEGPTAFAEFVAGLSGAAEKLNRRQTSLLENGSRSLEPFSGPGEGTSSLLCPVTARRFSEEGDWDVWEGR